MFAVQIIRGKEVFDVINQNMPKCIEVVADAYRAHGRKETINPDSYFLRFPDRPNSRIIALPARIDADFRVAGLKWIASFPDNVDKGFPRASAVLILNDPSTGYAFAIMEASIISAARTAASAVLAAGLLSATPRNAKKFTIVGNGLIARYVYRFLNADGWEIDEVCLFDRSMRHASHFKERYIATEKHARVEIAANLENAVRGADHLLFATVAGEPYVEDPTWFADGSLVLNVSLRDLSPDVILDATNVVDDVEHVLKANTSPHLTEQRVGHRRFIDAALADVLTAGKPQAKRFTVFSPFGLGVLDLAVGRWVHGEVIHLGTGTSLDDFYYDLER